jgi:hypothetical protein
MMKLLKFMKARTVYCLKTIWKTDYQYEYSFSWNFSYLTKICTARQVHFIDARFRSVKPAQDGTLVILVGSSDEDYMLANPF